MEQRHFCQASLKYVFLLQEVQECKKYEFVETVNNNAIWIPVTNNNILKLCVIAYLAPRVHVQLADVLPPRTRSRHRLQTLYGRPAKENSKCKGVPFDSSVTVWEILINFLFVEQTRENFETTRDQTKSLMNKMLELRKNVSLTIISVIVHDIFDLLTIYQSFPCRRIQEVWIKCTHAKATSTSWKKVSVF